MGRIYFRAISDYAERFGVVGSAFDQFTTFIRAIDDEYIAWAVEQAKDEAERNKRKSGQ